MIRSLGELNSALSDDLVWRRRELTDIRALAQTEGSSLRSTVLRRAGVALLYAHWEGFVKKASHYYLEYVASQRLKYSQLATNFVALSIKGRFDAMRSSRKVAAANEIADFYCNQMDRPSKVPFKNAVDTESNLSSSVLTDVLQALGLDVSLFATKLRLIDESLVNRRNHVAHGEHLVLDLDDYLALHDEVIALIDLFRNEIENASIMGRYKRV